MENLELTHINEQGRARMVDVTQKEDRKSTRLNSSHIH